MPTAIPAVTLDRLATFGDLLRFLRRRAGLTQLELAADVGYSDAQISRLEQNLRLPDIPTLEARFVPALGLQDEPEVIARLLDLAARARREDAPTPGLCPYKGLHYFDEEDADLFVGREALTAQLMERILGMTANQDPGKGRCLVVVGASGSGKSSLVRAGLVPTLRWTEISAHWLIQVLTPTAKPLESLATALTMESNSVIATSTLVDDLSRDVRSLHHFARRLVGPQPDARMVLVVDQFEEVFALCHSEEERSKFIGNLLTAATETGGPVILVIALRADFYVHCAQYGRLREALASQQQYIGAMNQDELRRVIEVPAERGRWELEPGLVDLLLRDVGHEPGALPLLSHALFEIWQRRRGRTMTLGGYASSQGVRGAIAETAEAVFTDQFTREQQMIARRIFLRLTEIGDESPTTDTRRQATLRELVAQPAAEPNTLVVLKALADARLIITHEETVEVAHEALIREWPRLRDWLAESREDVRQQRLLSAALKEWQAADQDPSYLLSGSRLTQFEMWAQQSAVALTPEERAYLQASVTEQGRQKSAEAARVQREQKWQHRARFFLWGLVTVLLAATFGAVGLTREAIDERNIAREERQRAEWNARIALARELVGYASDALDSDAELSTLLALQAVNQTYAIDGSVLPEAETVLHQAVQSLNPPRRIAIGTFPRLSMPSMSYSADGTRLVHPFEYANGTNSGLTGVSDVATGQLLYTVTGEVVTTVSADNRFVTIDGSPGAERLLYWDISSSQGAEQLDSYSIEQMIDTWTWADISTDFRYFLVTDNKGVTRLLDLTSGQQITSTADSIPLQKIALPWFNRDGDLLAGRNSDGTVSVFDTTAWNEVARIAPAGTYVSTFKFSQDGKKIITANRDNTVTVWDASTGREQFSILTGFPPTFTSLSLDGTRLAVGSASGQISLFDTETGQEQLSLSVSRVDEIILNPDGSRLVTWHNWGQIQIWDLIPGRELHTFVNEPVPDAGAVDLAFSPDGKQLIIASASNTPAVWDLQTERRAFTLEGHNAQVLAADWSADGRFLATAGEDTDVRLWDAATGEAVLTLSGHRDSIYGLAFSPDSGRLASSSFDQTVRIWDVVTGQLLLTLEQPGPSRGVAWSPEGLRVAAATDYALDLQGYLRVWDAQTGVLQLEVTLEDMRAGVVAFSPDGGRIVVGLQERSARVYDAQTGEVLLTLAGHIANVPGVAYSPNGTRIATSGIGEDRTIRLWDATSGQELLTLYAESGVSRVAFSPDGRLLASQHHDGTTRIYALYITELIALAESRLTRSLTDAECQRYLHVETCPATS